MAEQSEFAAHLLHWHDQATGIAAGWITSPAAWSQFALLAVAFAARVVKIKGAEPPVGA